MYFTETGRRTGKVTRLVDEAIQILFDTGQLKVSTPTLKISRGFPRKSIVYIPSHFQAELNDFLRRVLHKLRYEYIDIYRNHIVVDNPNYTIKLKGSVSFEKENKKSALIFEVI